MTMKDEEVERVLRRYRPIGPPRERVAPAVSPPTHLRRRVPLWAPAAALFILAVLLHWTATWTYGVLGRDAKSAAQAVREAQIESLALSYGGGDMARVEAARVLSGIDRETAARQPLGAPDPEGVSR
jgi:hypothetical protein